MSLSAHVVNAPGYSTHSDRIRPSGLYKAVFTKVSSPAPDRIPSLWRRHRLLEHWLVSFVEQCGHVHPVINVCTAAPDVYTRSDACNGHKGFRGQHVTERVDGRTDGRTDEQAVLASRDMASPIDRSNR
jgi:hypothetical protein